MDQAKFSNTASLDLKVLDVVLSATVRWRALHIGVEKVEQISAANPPTFLLHFEPLHQDKQDLRQLWDQALFQEDILVAVFVKGEDLTCVLKLLELCLAVSEEDGLQVIRAGAKVFDAHVPLQVVLVGVEHILHQSPTKVRELREASLAENIDVARDVGRGLKSNVAAVYHDSRANQAEEGPENDEFVVILWRSGGEPVHDA